MTLRERFNQFISTWESRWSLAAHLLAAAGSFALPAWAVRAAQIMVEYAPFSWVAAGFAGLATWSVIYLIWSVAFKIKVKAKYDVRLLDHGARVNPLDKSFEDKRIFISDFVLPSHPVLDGKSFYNCEIIGPANLYWNYGNHALENRDPKVDAVYLDPTKNFNNGIVLTNCHFRRCSFQRVTLFISDVDYQASKDNPLLNWITVGPEGLKIADTNVGTSVGPSQVTGE